MTTHNFGSVYKKCSCPNTHILHRHHSPELFENLYTGVYVLSSSSTQCRRYRKIAGCFDTDAFDADADAGDGEFKKTKHVKHIGATVS